MSTLKDFDANYTVLHHGEVVRQFTSNIWAFQETFRQVFGPGSEADSMIREWKGKTEIFVDPVHWDNPNCCASCKDEAKLIIEKMNQSQS